MQVVNAFLKGIDKFLSVGVNIVHNVIPAFDYFIDGFVNILSDGTVTLCAPQFFSWWY